MYVSIKYLSLGILALACISFWGCQNTNDDSESSLYQEEQKLPEGSTLTLALPAILHSEPSTTQGKLLTTIPSETVLNTTSRIGHWIGVSYEGQSGYLYDSFFYSQANNSTDSSDENNSTPSSDVQSSETDISNQPTSYAGIRTLSQSELDQIAESYDGTVKGFGTSDGRYDDQNRSMTALETYQMLEQFHPVFFGDQTSNTIYLSFSLGWENGTNTASILDALKQNNVKAVFYVTHEYASRNAELVQRMIDEGHEIGNHGYLHPDDGIPSLSLNEQMEDTLKMHQYIYENFNYTMRKYNFSSSYWSEQSVALMLSMGYEVYFYSFNYYDYNIEEQMDPSEAYDLMVSALTPGCIYYLHPVSDTNVQILGDFIQQAKSLGYSFGILP